VHASRRKPDWFCSRALANTATSVSPRPENWPLTPPNTVSSCRPARGDSPALILLASLPSSSPLLLPSQQPFTQSPLAHTSLSGRRRLVPVLGLAGSPCGLFSATDKIGFGPNYMARLSFARVSALLFSPWLLPVHSCTHLSLICPANCLKTSLPKAVQTIEQRRSLFGRLSSGGGSWPAKKAGSPLHAQLHSSYAYSHTHTQLCPLLRHLARRCAALAWRPAWTSGALRNGRREREISSRRFLIARSGALLRRRPASHCCPFSSCLLAAAFWRANIV